MNFDRGYRFFLKVAFVFLVASILLPFAFETMITRTFSRPPVVPNRTNRHLSFYWSFTYVRVSVQIAPDEPPGQQSVWTLWLTPPRCWEIHITPNRPNPLQSMFVLQIILLLIGFFTVKWARRVRSMVPFFLGILTLDALCFSIATAYYRTPSFGCWLLVVATLFIYIALVRAKTRTVAKEKLSAEERCRLIEKSLIPTFAAIVVVVVYLGNVMYFFPTESALGSYMLFKSAAFFLPNIMAIIAYEIFHSIKAKKIPNGKRFTGRMVLVITVFSSLVGFLAIQLSISPFIDKRYAVIIGCLLCIITFSIVVHKFRYYVARLLEGKW